MRSITLQKIISFTFVVTLLEFMPTHWLDKGYAQEDSSRETPVISLPTTDLPNPVPSPSRKLSLETEDQFVVHKVEGISGRIAFSVKIEDIWRIFVLDLDEGKVRRLVEAPGNNYFPSFSKRGERLAFVSDRTGHPEVFVTDWLGTETSQKTTSAAEKMYPTWYPDGDGILYATFSAAEGRSSFWSVNPNSNVSAVITTLPGKNSTPHLSPDMTSVIYSMDRSWPGLDICLHTRATNQETCVLTGSKTFERPRFSHNGESIAVSYGDAGNRDIATFTFKGSAFKQLSTMPRMETDPEWSQDDKFIAFVADGSTIGRFDMWVLDTETGTSQLLVESPYSIRYLSWSAVRTIDLEIARIQSSGTKAQ
jgi:Tol biopolymer transport system component